MFNQSINQYEEKHSSTFSDIRIENRVTEEKIAQGLGGLL